MQRVFTEREAPLPKKRKQNTTTRPTNLPYHAVCSLPLFLQNRLCQAEGAVVPEPLVSSQALSLLQERPRLPVLLFQLGQHREDVQAPGHIVQGPQILGRKTRDLYTKDPLLLFTFTFIRILD